MSEDGELVEWEYSSGKCEVTYVTENECLEGELREKMRYIERESCRDVHTTSERERESDRTSNGELERAQMRELR